MVKFLTLLKVAVIIVSATLFISCSITQPVRVLKPDETQIDASLGGAFIPLGANIPVPYLITGASYGYSENLTLSSHLHITPFVVSVLGLDVGATTRLFKQDGAIPEITAKGQVQFFTDFKSAETMRFLPIATLNGSWLVGESTLVYAGADNIFQFYKPYYFISPLAGTQFDIGSSFRMNVEGKWMVANANTEQNVYEGETSVGGSGGFGLFFGLSYMW